MTPVPVRSTITTVMWCLGACALGAVAALLLLLFAARPASASLLPNIAPTNAVANVTQTVTKPVTTVTQTATKPVAAAANVVTPSHPASPVVAAADEVAPDLPLPVSAGSGARRLPSIAAVPALRHPAVPPHLTAPAPLHIALPMATLPKVTLPKVALPSIDL